MKMKKQYCFRLILAATSLILVKPKLLCAEEKVNSSYLFQLIDSEPIEKVMANDKAQKEAVMKKHLDLLNERYDLSKKVTSEVTMTKGKPLPVGPTAKLKKGLTWEKLAQITPDEIKEQGIFPYLPLPHPNHPVGGMLFSKTMINEIAKQEHKEPSRLERFDLDFDLPDHFLPEFPPPIFLTTHKELGDVSQGKLITINNYYELFNGLLNPKQLEGVRLLVTSFPQQQFNATADRKTEQPSLGVTCFDCHVNGHTNAATHLVGDIRPHENRSRLDSPSLRGVNIQRLFGSQRALKSVEDFTEFEQRAAYFDGDHTIAAKKGINILERGSQVHFMSEVLALLDFPPAPKFDIYGRLIMEKATKSEIRGEELFFGKAKCNICHPAPYYTDNLMHDLQVERFYKDQLISGQFIHAEGKIKTFPLRGIKDSPPYLHDGRLLTLEDVVEFFNLVQQLKLRAEEKQDLVAFLRQL